MNFVVSSDILSKNIQLLSKVVTSSSTIPIIENFYFKAVKDNMEIWASDMETTICATIENFSVNDEISFAAPAKRIAELLKTLPVQPLNFTVQTDEDGLPKSLQINSEQGEYMLPCFSGEDFPIFDNLDQWDINFNLETDTLAESLENSLFCTVNDNSSTAIMGILFDNSLDASKINIVSTDLLRLTYSTIALTESISKLNVIVPKKPLTLLQNILQETKDDNAEIKANERGIFFSVENIRLFTRQINDTYPNYKDAFPQNNPFNLVISKSALMQSLKRLQLFSNESTNMTEIDIKGNSLTLRANENSLMRKANETLSCQYAGEDFKILFNSKTFLEMISHIYSEEINLSFSSSKNPIIITPHQSSSKVDCKMLQAPLVG